MALGIILIAFIEMSVISILGLLLMYLLKNERAKAVAFYCMSVWGMAISVLNAITLPSNYTLSRMIAWGLGFLSVVGLIIHVRAKSKSQRMAAYILVTISIIACMLKIFIL